MSVKEKYLKENKHRFLDEAGDMTFFGKGGAPKSLGDEGISKSFMIGMVNYKGSMSKIRKQISEFTSLIESDPFFNTFPSVEKRISKGGFYFHANKDPAELRYKFFEFIRDNIDFTLQVVVGRKDLGRFVNKHNKKESEFYADLLIKLLADKGNHLSLILNIAQLGSTNHIKNLEYAAEKAKVQFEKNHPGAKYQAKLNFNIQPYQIEPLLSVADYGLWAVQRVFETGETRFYDLIKPKVRYVTDPFDPLHKDVKSHSYTPRKPLTSANKL